VGLRRHAVAPQVIDRALQVHGIPQNDGGHDGIQATRTIALVFIGSVADFAEAIEDRARGVTRFAARLCSVPRDCGGDSGSCIQSRVNKVRSTLPRPSSRSAWANPFLALIGGELAQHDGCRNRAGHDRGRYAQKCPASGHGLPLY
jgi:hypothetical protein